MQDESSPPEGGDVFGHANALPKGTRLFEFEIERVLGEGGFAIVYLAFDHSLHRRVALKEYLPAEFAFRQDEHTIVLRSVQYQSTFEAGRKSFVQEARFLAQFEHPSLVKVHRVFESNGTAYMVQGYYPGESLAAMIKAGHRFGGDIELRPIVASLLRAVELLHARQCLHRDIAPDNIIVQPNGVPVLLDFGAARRIIGDMTQALTAVLKPSYAPIEQYTEEGGLAQGPWTDVYALAATLRAAITGKPPPSSVGRTIKDALVKLADDPPPGFDLAFLRGVDAGLAILPADRPQTIAAFREALGIPEDEADTAPAAVAPLRASDAPAKPESFRSAATTPRSRAGVPPPPIPLDDATLPGVPAPLAPLSPASAPSASTPSALPPSPASPPAAATAVRAAPPPPLPRPEAASPPRRRFKRSDVGLIVIGVAAVLLMLLVPFAADWIWPSPANTPSRAERPGTAPAPASAPSSASPTPSLSAPAPSPPVVTAAAPPVVTPAAPPPAASAPRPAPPTAIPAAPVAASPARDPKETKPAAPAAAPPAQERPPVALPAAAASKSTAPAEPATPPRQEAPKPAAATSLIPSPSAPPSLSPTPSPSLPQSPPPAHPPAAATAPSSATVATAPAAKARRSLVRIAGEAPVYPREAIRAGVESGRVVALVTVDERGGVADIAIVTSEPARVFDRVARTALESWKFKPEGERYQGEVELLFNLRP